MRSPPAGGGVIRVRDVPGRGGVFMIHLPRMIERTESACIVQRHLNERGTPDESFAEKSREGEKVAARRPCSPAEQQETPLIGLEYRAEQCPSEEEALVEGGVGRVFIAAQDGEAGRVAGSLHSSDPIAGAQQEVCAELAFVLPQRDATNRASVEVRRPAAPALHHDEGRRFHALLIMWRERRTPMPVRPVLHVRGSPSLGELIGVLRAAQVHYEALTLERRPDEHLGRCRIHELALVAERASAVQAGANQLSESVGGHHGGRSVASSDPHGSDFRGHTGRPRGESSDVRRQGRTLLQARPRFTHAMPGAVIWRKAFGSGRTAVLCTANAFSISADTVLALAEASLMQRDCPVRVSAWPNRSSREPSRPSA